MKAVSSLPRWIKRMLDYGQQIVRDFSWHRRFSGPDMPSLGTRILEQARLLYSSGIDGEDYYHHGLYRRGLPFSEKARFLGFFRCSRYYQAINPPRFDLIARDKVIFHMLATALMLPVPKLLAVTRSPGQPTCGQTLETLDELRVFLQKDDSQNLFLKPGGGMGGEGALSLGNKIVGREAWRMLPGNSEITLDEVIAHVCHGGEMRRFLIQDRLRSHEVLEEIVPKVCSTIRLMTFADRGGISVMGAALRLGNGREPTDNLSGGGVVAEIDLESGSLGRVVSLEHDMPDYLSSHPKSGVKISGKTIPNWAGVIELAVESAKKLAFLPCIGWDIAVTDKGPVIVEINSRPRCRPIQVANDCGLLRSSFLDALLRNDGTLGSGLHLKNHFSIE